MSDRDGVQMTPEEIEDEQTYREVWSMPGTSLLKRASGQSTR